VITRTVRLQVLAFLVVSLLGVGYVSMRYIGLGDYVFGGGYLVRAEFATAGGIFPNAAVTYRGVPVGRVSGVRLRGGGVEVDLHLTRAGIPADLHAVTTVRSAVGEQYVDLRPDTDTGPYLRDGDVIPASRTGTPLPVETLLSNLDSLVRSVDGRDLTVLIDELGTAFEGNADALRRLVDATDGLVNGAVDALPQTLALIRDGRTVLATQQDELDAIRRWAASLDQLSATLRQADPDLRRLLAAGPPAATQLIGLLRDLDPTIGTLLGNLVTVDGIAARQLPGIEQILVEYPLVVAGGFTVAPGDGTAHFGLVVNLDNPAPCQYGQGGQSGCNAVRGTNRAPGRAGPGPSPAPLGGPPQSGSQAAPGPAAQAGAPTVGGFDPVTGLVLAPDGQPMQFGGTGGQQAIAGAQSWKQLLLAGLAG
jgi:phospholipid/cholesterol/gamma-HCH transport system substrate-binding protein